MNRSQVTAGGIQGEKPALERAAQACPLTPSLFHAFSRPGRWLARAALLLALSSGAQAADVAASATGAAEKALSEALKSFEGSGLVFTLRTQNVPSPVFTLGGGGVPFNPDAGSRTLVRRGVREVQVNPSGALPVAAVWRSEAARLLGLDEPMLLSGARAVTDADREVLKARYLSGGDLNGDGKIDLTDLAILASNYGKVGPGLRGDLNGDGKVDALDVAIFQELYKFLGADDGDAPAPSAPTSPTSPTPPTAPATPPPPPADATPPVQTPPPSSPPPNTPTPPPANPPANIPPSP